MSARAAFHLLDVFTRRKLEGRPLAVLDCESALEPREMALLAHELAAPTTAFVLPARDPINTARLVSFSPQGEEHALAPHAAIGAAAVLAQSRAPEILAHRSVVVTIETRDETRACEVIRSRHGTVYAELALDRAPVRRDASIDPMGLAQAVGLHAGDLGFGAHEPRVYDCLAPYCLAPVRSRSTLERARPVKAALAPLLGAAQGLYLYAADPNESDAAIHARLINRDGADALASGKALAAFAGAALEFERPSDGPHELVVEQGHAAGRPARLTLRMEVFNGSLANLHIGGQTTPIVSGVLQL